MNNLFWAANVNFMPSERPLEGGALQTNLEHICEQTAAACCCFLDKSHCVFLGGAMTRRHFHPPSVKWKLALQSHLSPASGESFRYSLQRNVEDPNARHDEADRLIHKEPKTSSKKQNKYKPEARGTQAGILKHEGRKHEEKYIRYTGGWSGTGESNQNNHKRRKQEEDKR